MGDDSSVSFGMTMDNNKQDKAREKRISDANHWSYTNLLKQNGMSDATQWSYTNLHRQRNKSGYRIPNYLDLYQSPTTKTTFGCQMPIYLGLYQPPTYDHRKANANLQGLTIASSHTTNANASSKEKMSGQ